MTLRELYANIEGDYDQALRVLRVEKLMDKHIRKMAQNGVAERLLAAGKIMDATELFESAHAMKGACGNLGLVKLSELASQISEEFRPGSPRTLTDAQVADLVSQLEALYQKTVNGIRQYTGA